MTYKETKNLVRTHLETSAHKFWVLYHVLKVCKLLVKRAVVHDLSKYSKKEAIAFANSPRLKDLPYNSPDYYISLKRIDDAISNHYSINSHHPQYHKNGFDDMSLLDVIEMICDWKSAVKRHKDGDIFVSIEENAQRFGYSQKTKEKFIQLAKEI